MERILRGIIGAGITLLIGCVEIEHSGEVDINHNISIDEIEIVISAEAGVEVAHDVTISADKVASDILNKTQ